MSAAFSWLPKHEEPAVAEVEDQLVWFGLYVGLYVAFYFFTSPFVGNPELLNSWTPYVYLSMGLYAWLVAAAALHMPLGGFGLTDSAVIKQPISMLFPFFSVSFVMLVVLELLMVLCLSRVTKLLGLSWRLANVTLVRSFMNVLRNSAAISVACVALILHCDASIEGPADPLTYNRHVCGKLFNFSSPKASGFVVPVSYQGAILIWFAGMALAITNFVLERMSGLRVVSFDWLSERKDEDETMIGESLHERLPPEHNVPMVPWYSMFLFDTAFQLLISFKVFLGRFDQRAMQKALTPDDAEYLFDHLAERDDLWLDFMADCGDGFNSSYQIARMLAQPTLEVDCEEEVAESEFESEDNTKSGSPTSSKNKKPRMRKFKRTFPRGEVLVIGGDLAYPHPEAESYETRLFRCFEYAMRPPRDYDPQAISTPASQPIKSLREYKGPSAFAIPGNHDWFDGLNTFTRYICKRDWLGGWFMPQKTSHFCLKLPHGWWLFGVDLALENDINTEQFSLFQRIAEKHMREDDAVIIVTHEPRWVLDAYENSSSSEDKLAFLMNKVLKGRVVLRLAGDIHNYTRHSRSTRRRDSKSRTTSSTNEPTVRVPSLSLPRRASWQASTASATPGKRLRTKLARRASMTESPMSPKNRVFMPVTTHFPFMFGAGTRTNRSKRSAEHLIVSGGGGAFLHPTHAPVTDKLEFNGASYNRECCYPPVHVSKRYALLNVIGFRRINWRFDVIGGLAYFLLVLSLFPRCSVGAIYSSSSWLEVTMRFVKELVHVLVEMLTTSYLSLSISVAMLVTLIGFADCTTPWRKCLMGFSISCLHFLAAFTILLVFESILDVATTRGTLGREGANSFYNFFTDSVPDFSGLRNYDVLNLSYLYTDFMRICMTIFDVPEVVALHRIKICESSGGMAALTRIEQLTYYVSVFPYFWVLATPVVGAVFGLYLYVALNIFGCHYNEAFSALRIASYKNFLRLHFTPEGDLEVFAFGIDKMPRKWCRDPKWSGGIHTSQENTKPSYEWSVPSYWRPLITKVDNMLRLDFENPKLDGKFNTSDRSNVHLIDHIVLRKPEPSSYSSFSSSSSEYSDSDI